MSRTAVPVPADPPVMFQEGDPVEYDPGHRSYASRVRAKGALNKRETATSQAKSSHRLLSPGPSNPHRLSPYQHSQMQEKVLNVVSEHKPRTQLSPSPFNSASTSLFSSPESHSSALKPADKVIFLERKLSESQAKCRNLERQYHDLLTKQIRTEQQLETEMKGKSSERDRVASPLAEETTSVDPGLGSQGSVEGLLRQVLEELRDLKGRMARIEKSTAKISKSDT